MVSRFNTKRRTFTVKQKVEAVERSKMIGVTAAAREAGIERRLLQKWKATNFDIPNKHVVR